MNKGKLNNNNLTGLGVDQLSTKNIKKLVNKDNHLARVSRLCGIISTLPRRKVRELLKSLNENDYDFHVYYPGLSIGDSICKHAEIGKLYIKNKNGLVWKKVII